MSRVICDLPNASLEISGVRFQKLEDGRFISDEIGDEVTAIFLSIPGYELDEDESESDLPPAPPEQKPLTKTQIAKVAKATGGAKGKTASAAPAAQVEPVAPVVETKTTDDTIVPGADNNAANVEPENGGEQTTVTGAETDATAPVVVEGGETPVNTEDKPADVF